MLQLTPHMRLLVCVEPIDFRNGIDGLVRVCRATLGEDPFRGTVFVFRNRRSSCLATGLRVTDSAPRGGTDSPRVELVQREPARMVTSKPQTIVEMNVAERETLLTRAAESSLAAEDVARFRAICESYAYVSELIDQKNLTLEPAAPADCTAATSSSAKRRRGHGRNGADDLPGAVHVQVRLDGLQPGGNCPACGDGTHYELNQSGVHIRFVGQVPVRATIYELQKLRCQFCGNLFTAEPPAEAGARKYDETVGSLIGILKYGHGFPFHRFAQMQDHLDVPLAASTQWDLVALAAESYQPVYEELLRQAAQGELVMNDDTTAKILAWMGRRRAKTFAAAVAAAAVDGDAPLIDATTAPTTAATTVSFRQACTFSKPAGFSGARWIG